MVAVERRENASLTGRFYAWFGGGDSTGFILKMLMPAIFVFIIGILFPLLYGIFVSFFYYETRSTRTFVLIGTYSSIFSDPRFWASYFNTLFFVVVTVSMELLLGLIMALVLNKEFKGRGLVRAAILVPWAIPTIVNARIWEYVFGPTVRSPVNDILVSIGIFESEVLWTAGRVVPVNWVRILSFIVFLAAFCITAYNLYTKYFNALTDQVDFSTKEITLYVILVVSFVVGVLLPSSLFESSSAFGFASTQMERDWIVVFIVDIWKTTPFMALLILAGLQVIPRDLLKAAEVDGANAWQKFRNVTFPLLLPSLGVALLFRLIDAFRVYDIFAIFNAEGIEPITKYAVKKHGAGRYGASSAVAIFTFVNIIVMTIITMGLTRRRTSI